MAKDQVEEIKRKVDIVEVVGERIPLKKSGRNYKALCPFHSEKTPSFMVSQELQIFKCFGCGLGGDVYKFLMEYEKIDFPQALRILADRVGVKLERLRDFPGYAQKDEIILVNRQARDFYHYILVSHRLGEEARLYLRKRGITEETIKTFKLGFAPDRPDPLFGFLSKRKAISPQVLEKAGLVVLRDGRFFDRFRGRIMFPLNDHFGNTVGFSGRILREQGEQAKYINTPETLLYKKGRLLYGLDITKGDIKREKAAVVVEGEFDLLSCWQVGIKNIVAIKGSALTEDQAVLLSRFCDIIFLALDSDFAGSEAARRGIEILEKVGLETRVVRFGDFKDPDEAAQKDPAGLKEAIKQALEIYDFLIESVFERCDVSTTEGKARASRLLTPILARIDDEIVKADLAKKIAERLNVPQEAVALQVKKQEAKTRIAPVLPKTSDLPSRRRLLEERLLRLIFQNKPELAKSREVTEKIQTPALRQIVARFGGDLPAELQDLYASLMLLEEEMQEPKLSEEIERITKLLEVMDIKERIRKIRDEIKKTDKDEQEILLRDLSFLTRKLSNLEVETKIV